MDSGILLAVNDSPAGFGAAAVAIAHAHRLGCTLHVVTVVDTGSAASVEFAAGQEKSATAVLRHVAALGAKARVEVITHLRHGAVATEILGEARDLGCEFIVMALVDRPGHATPYIGSHTLAVLEFAQTPVMVVPAFHASTPA
ncbi:hypothetical protein BH11ACT4_BH11ACT4_18170 [soil metagenome]